MKIELKILKVEPTNIISYCGDFDSPKMTEWITDVDQFESAYIEVDKNKTQHYYIANENYIYEVTKSSYLKVKNQLLGE